MSKSMSVGQWVAAVIVSVGLVSTPALAADQYAIDASHSTVGFTVPHLMISRVHGAFSDVSGTIIYDEANPAASSVDVTIKTSSIDTRHPKRDEHLRSADFFDAEQFPEITFKSTRIEHEGDTWAAIGILRMHGVTKEVRLPFRILGKIQDPWGKTRLGIEADMALNRQDYDITWNKAMDAGGVMVGNDVKVLLSVEAVKE